ncbi:MAG TPA: hypothetical protein VFY87_02210 [Geminicoccaceae bacterium]|nr:hypothetical protein [Geminicoccaceae bacterium]
MTRTTRRHLGVAVGLAALLAGPGPVAAQAEQGTPSPSDMPSSGDAPTVLRPVPDIHGRAGQGATEQHGNDSASPGGTGGTSVGGPTGAGATMGGTVDSSSGANVPNQQMPAQGSQQ